MTEQVFESFNNMPFYLSLYGTSDLAFTLHIGYAEPNGGHDMNEIAVINARNLNDRIYIIRGQKVMLDFDLAEIYGYTTKRFNEQVKNNEIKFDSDFRFRTTQIEIDILRSKKSTSRKNSMFTGQSGGSRNLPYAFTELGIYMLMKLPTMLRKVCTFYGKSIAEKE